MSAAASWSYTAKATLWPLLSRDAWSGAVAFGPPATFDCDYSSKSERMTDSKGVEFVTRQIIYTEKADAKQGDMVLIGEHAGADPAAAGAVEVRLIARDADTLDRLADDFQLIT